MLLLTLSEHSSHTLHTGVPPQNTISKFYLSTGFASDKQKTTDMPPMSARHVTQKVVTDIVSMDSAYRLPWNPVSNIISVPRQPPKPATLDEKKQQQKREALSAIANQRYEDWKTKQPAAVTQSATSSAVMEERRAHRVSAHFPTFRDRRKSKDLAGEWASADQVLRERERIELEVSRSTSSFLQNPPYPKSGGGLKNVEFSYMKSGYAHLRTFLC